MRELALQTFTRPLSCAADPRPAHDFRPLNIGWPETCSITFFAPNLDFLFLIRLLSVYGSLEVRETLSETRELALRIVPASRISGGPKHVQITFFGKTLDFISLIMLLWVYGSLKVRGKLRKLRELAFQTFTGPLPAPGKPRLGLPNIEWPETCPNELFPDKTRLSFFNKIVMGLLKLGSAGNVEHTERIGFPKFHGPAASAQ
ncbi:hypothetical protein M5689_011094 [Euphorbia peplus]|nr:hypothetical protein M5689_011094 [Euphorbia peplus]